MGDNREDNPHEISFLENRKVDYESSFKHNYFSKQSSLPDGTSDLFENVEGNHQSSSKPKEEDILWRFSAQNVEAQTEDE